MGKQEYTVDEFREKILFDIEIETSDSVILMCAILIASIGLNMNSLPVIFGAMLISPLMSPLLGVGYGLSVFDFAVVKKAAKLLLLEVVVSLAVATIYFSLSPITYASSEIIARTSPTIWDVIIAFAGGLAGIIGARSCDCYSVNAACLYRRLLHRYKKSHLLYGRVLLVYYQLRVHRHRDFSRYTFHALSSSGSFDQ